MECFSWFWALLPLLFLASASTPPRIILETDKLAAGSLANQVSYAAKHSKSTSCDPEIAAKRREWGDLSDIERREYINAVLCLAAKPSITPPSLVPGARSRYDDFVATHMNQTLSIHATGNFLTWHRYFVWTYEQALRNECGYSGYQPYYNWPKWADNPKASPALDGSDTSMSGDGSFVKHSPIGIPNNQEGSIFLPPAQGGGCVTSGPFANFTVNLGPVVPALADVPPNPNNVTGFGHNPRCLRRDINSFVSSTWTNDSSVSGLIKDNSDIYWFAFLMQGGLFENDFLGVHSGGHYTINGDPGGDFFVSPGDPWFFLHHSMIDRTYWTWQNQDPEKRTYAISQTITLLNSPPSRNATIEDFIDLGVNAPPIKIKDVMNTLNGPLCYVFT